MANILWLSKRTYMRKDLLEDRYGRYFELPVHLSTMGHRIHVLALSYHREPRVQFAENRNLEFESIDIRHFPRYLYRALRLIRERNIEVVIGSSDMHFCVLAYCFGRSFGKSVVFDIYDNFDTYQSAKFWPLGPFYYRLLGKTDLNVAFTETLSIHLEHRAPGAPYAVVPNSVDKDLFHPLDRKVCRERFNLSTNKTLIGYFGAIEQSRGLGILFKAVRILQNKGLDCQLVLAGPSDRQTLAKADRSALYLGQLAHQEIPWLINACDVNVICYKKDAFARFSFPFKAAEYIACRVPFVAPAVGGMVGFLHDHPEYLYEAESAESLAKQISKIVAREEHHFPFVPTWTESAASYSTAIDHIRPSSLG